MTPHITPIQALFEESNLELNLNKDAGVRFLSAINAAYASAESVIHTVGDEFVDRINKLPEKEKEQFFKEFKGKEDMVITGKKTFAEQCAELHDCLPVNPTKDALTELHNQMINYITELEAQLADAKNDAERYQWLRNYLMSTDTSHDDNTVNASSHIDFDIIIDAAIQAEGKA